ncbi:MAG: ribose 5-phosphate isomerase A [Solirubrobacterales bacterium]|nr:ribose 5-phosphate isomerase A [Solirubrobacterales bacterium]
MYSAVDFEAFDDDAISNLEAKRGVADRLAASAESGQTIGAGSGSTAYLAVRAIAARVAAGELERVTLVPTSLEIEMTIAGLDLPVGDLFADRPDWLFDGADEVDPAGSLIKGRGGAMFREKLLFKATDDRRVLVDASKAVEKLGSKFPVPVEVVPRALPVVVPELESLGAVELQIRTGSGKDGPVLTELGNVIVDCRFDEIAGGLEVAIKSTTGVVESGLFQGYEPTLVSP